MTTDRTPAGNSGLAKVAVQCSADSLVVNQTLVLRINICGKIATFAKPRNVTSNCMTTQTIIIISTLTALFFSSCKSTPDLTEDEVYTILNEIIADDSLRVKRTCWKFQDINLTPEIKKEFTEQDLIFIRRQKDLFQNLVIKPNKLKWFHRQNNVFVNTTIDTVCDQGILYHISFPSISADRQKVIIEFQEDCNCMLGGQGGKHLYEKKNGHWVQTKEFDHWISDNKKRAAEKQLLVTAPLSNAGYHTKNEHFVTKFFLS